MTDVEKKLKKNKLQILI